ncbi:MAG: hypothetical protein KJO25_01235, partial [Bacteroidia bacterium]|nr:hypothetical protein [Bacteroidia bacterium]
RWGWTLGPLSEGYVGDFDIYAGAGKCDIGKGMLVGTLEVDYTDGTLTVEYKANPGYGWFETHLYVGSEPIPSHPKNGKPTVAPGQYGNQNEISEGASTDSYVIDGLSGDIYIIAHAVVCEFEECEVDPGTLKAAADKVCLKDGFATLEAYPDGNAVVPDGYQVLYVLTQGAELVIIGVNTDPIFEVDAVGLYTIHTLVYDPATLDLGIVVPGVTTGFDVFGLLIAGGGDICAGLDVAGAPILVEKCD